MQYNKNKSSTNGSSHRMFSIKKVVLRNFSKFTGKHLCQSLFFNKAAGLVPNAPFLYPLKTSENHVLLFFQTLVRLVYLILIMLEYERAKFIM